MMYKIESIDLDFDSNMEPSFRARSNTWPLPRPDHNEAFQEVDEHKCSEDGNSVINGIGIDQSLLQTSGQLSDQTSPLDHSSNGSSGGPKKNTSRRNAWGNMSYADLITQAINGSPEKRLTLSQIYDWMVQNVPYFKDKGDSNSSAGWKNSIRHNLSLHNRFMRVQNEGTGKSSWWMINPEAKPGKAARRRATSMETQKYEKKRGRVKKKVEQLKNRLTLDHNATPSPSSSVSEGLDMFPDSPLHHGFQLSPEFRPRASSNASSCGRLSPIPAVENDMHDRQVPPLSPMTWPNDINILYTSNVNEDYNSTEQLVEMANTMKLGGNNAFLGVNKASPTGQLSPASSHVILNNNYNLSSFTSLNDYNNSKRNGSNDPFFQTQPPSESGTATLTALNTVSGPRSPSRTILVSDGILGTNNAYSLTNLSPVLSPSQSMDTLAPLTGNSTPTYSPQHQAQSNTAQNRGAYCHTSSLLDSSALLRSLNAQKALESSSLAVSPVATTTSSSVTSLGTTASQVMGHLLSLNNPLPNDLDLNFDSLQGGLECDVDQVIRHELSVDGTLDFNFDPLHHGSSNSNTSVAHSSTMTSAPSSRSWVH